MKSFVIAGAAAVLFAGAASAAELTVNFESSEGVAQTWVFNDETKMSTSPDGVEAPYTWDEETLTVCGEMPEQGELCVTFEEMMVEEGATTGYTTSDGGSGTATLVSMTGMEE